MQNTLIKSAENRDLTTDNRPGRAVNISAKLHAVESGLAAVGGQAVTCQFSGTATVNSECGTGAYALSATLTYDVDGNTLSLRPFSVTGARLTGYEAGALKLAFKTEQAAPAANWAIATDIAMSDVNNTDLLLKAKIHGVSEEGRLQALTLTAEGVGFNFAEFLADGESLDEESGDTPKLS